MKPLIEIRNLTKEYGLGDAKVKALNDINLNIDEGEFLVVLGSSGSGKSTLLNMIGAMDLPTCGDVLYSGESIISINKKKRCEFRRNNIGFIFQNFSLIPDLTAKENVELLEEVKKISIQTILENTHNNYADYVKIRNELREKIGAYLYKETGCKPVILIVIQEIEV